MAIHGCEQWPHLTPWVGGIRGPHLTYLCALGLYGTHGLHLREQVRHAQRVVHVPQGVHEGRVALAHDVMKRVLVTGLIQLSSLRRVITPRALADLW